MFAYPRRLALGIVSLAALLLSLGLVALSATPAMATTCGSFTFGAQSFSDCSEIFAVGSSGGVFTVGTTPFNANGSPYLFSAYDNSGDVVVGVTNTSGQTAYDLQVTNYLSQPIFLFTALNANERLSNTSLAALVGSCAGPTGDEGIIIGPVHVANPCVFFNIVSTSAGDVVFGSGLPSGDTAIFALTATAAAGCVTNQAGACVTTTVSEPAAIGIFLTGLLGFGILRRRWLARAASPRRPRPQRQSRQIRPTGWISRLLATA